MLYFSAWKHPLRNLVNYTARTFLNFASKNTFLEASEERVKALNFDQPTSMNVNKLLQWSNAKHKVITTRSQKKGQHNL